MLLVVLTPPTPRMVLDSHLNLCVGSISPLQKSCSTLLNAIPTRYSNKSLTILVLAFAFCNLILISNLNIVLKMLRFLVIGKKHTAWSLFHKGSVLGKKQSEWILWKEWAGFTLVYVPWRAQVVKVAELTNATYQFTCHGNSYRAAKYVWHNPVKSGL